VGVLTGGILQLLCQLPALRRQGYLFRPSFRFNNPDLRRTAKLWVPYLASASIVAINQYIATLFASGLEDGSVTAIANSVMFLQIPLGIFMTSVATVQFPKMSRQAAAQDMEGLRGSVSYGIQFIIILLVPSAVLLCLFGKEIISATIQRGHFRPQGTLLASRALTAYALGLVSMGLYTFLQRLFNSFKSFVVPIASAAVIAVIDIVLSLILKETPLRVSGLAYANTIAFTAGMILLMILARRRLGRVGLASILLTLGKSILGSLPMAALLIVFLRWKPDAWVHGGALRTTALFAGVVALAVCMTLLMYALLRVPFLADLFRKRQRT
jgi:putative peptidoglycan lipid II flippase